MTPRLMQEPEKHTKTLRKLVDVPWLRDCTWVQARVTSLQPKEATLDSGQSIPFDYCVICTGAPARRL